MKGNMKTGRLETYPERETSILSDEYAPREDWSFSLRQVGVVPGTTEKRIVGDGELKNHLASKARVRWIRLGDLLASESDACVDGREVEPVIGNPGGDVVKLAEAIHAFGDNGEKLKPQNFEVLLRWYVKRFGTFYMHTDEHALEALGESLKENEEVFGKYKLETSADVYELITETAKKDKGRQMTLFSYLIDPDHMGCGHLKKMMQDPGKYGVSEKVLRSLMRAYFSLMWNDEELSQQLVYKVLKGGHEEGAVLSVLSAMPENEEVDDETMVPMVAPSGENGLQVFVNHPQVQGFLHNRIVEAIIKEGPIEALKDVELDSVLESAENRANKGLTATVNALAAGLPIYQAEFVKE